MLFAVKGRPAWVFLSAVEFERPEDKRVDPDREITVRIKRWVAVEKGWAVSSSQ